MGLPLLMVTGGLVVAGYLAYRKLQDWEREIRDEIDSGEGKKAPSGQGTPPPTPLRPMPPAAPAAAPAAAPDRAGDHPPAADLSGRLLARIGKEEGVLQTELYADFPEVDRRTLQNQLLELDREGKIRRDKEKSSYRLFLR